MFFYLNSEYILFSLAVNSLNREDQVVIRFNGWGLGSLKVLSLRASILSVLGYR